MKITPPPRNSLCQLPVRSTNHSSGSSGSSGTSGTSGSSGSTGSSGMNSPLGPPWQAYK